MSIISHLLVSEILNDNTVLIYGGGFKPPTKGHFQVIKQSIQKHPNFSKYIIFVGSGERDNITQQQSVDVWNIYKNYLSPKIEVIPVSSPVRSTFEYSKENLDKKIIWILGGREGNEDDIVDFNRRTQTISKYPNLTVSHVVTPLSDVSGTKARQALKSQNINDLINYLPKDILSNEDMEAVLDILSSSSNNLTESKQKFGYRAGKFEPNNPSDTLKDKGIGITNTKVGLLGTGYYFFGSKEKAEQLKVKSNYSTISQIDLSQYKLFRPEDPEGFYENIKSLTSYIHSLTRNELEDPKTKEIIEDAVEGFSEYLNIPHEKTNKIINEYISDIINKKLDGPLLSNRLLFDYDGIDTTGTSLDDFSVGSIIFSGKLKPGTYGELGKLNENATYSNHIDYKQQIKELTRYYLSKYPNIKTLPKVIFKHNNKSNAKEFLGKTAYYDPNTKTIVLYTEGRHPKDLVRSFSHEFIHFIQDMEGRLNNISTTNTQEDDYLNDIESEANLKGTMTFRNWTDSLNESLYLDIPKFNQPKTIQQYLVENINEISLSKENAADINGDLTGGTFTVGDITYEYSIKNISNPYKDLGTFYNIQFTPRGEVTSIPKGGKENYIKILSTMYKIIVDFIEKEKPTYIGISSLDNTGSKNYHTVYNRLTDNNLKLIPGYFRKDSNLQFDSPQGKGRFIVLQRKNNTNESKSKEYLKEYKQYVLNELFEKDLPIIEKVSKNLYIVSNGDDIEAKYNFRLEIPERDIWSVNWFFTPDNKNKSPEAWKQVTATSFKVLEDWLKTNNPKAIHISGNTGAKNRLYKTYIDKLQTLLNNRYKIDNSDEFNVVLRSIEEVYQSGIKKRMETLNESYQQALSYWKDGDVYSKSKIERWGGMKKKIERQVIQEIYQTKKSNISEINNKKDIFGLSAYATELGKLREETTKYKIYCDLDGVLVDFDQGYKNLTGMTPQQGEQLGKEKFWEPISKAGAKYWITLKWMKDGKQLWNYISKYNPSLLSAPSREESSKIGKRVWVKRELPGVKLILTPADQKRKYANENSILIDDRKSNIEQWIENGGIGILHTSTQNTIEELKKLGL